MSKVNKTTYESIPKNNELTKLTTEIKQAIQKIEEKEKKKKDNWWLCKINSINKKRIPKVSVRKWFIKEKIKKTRR